MEPDFDYRQIRSHRTVNMKIMVFLEMTPCSLWRWYPSAELQEVSSRATRDFINTTYNGTHIGSCPVPAASNPNIFILFLRLTILLYFMKIKKLVWNYHIYMCVFSYLSTWTRWLICTKTRYEKYAIGRDSKDLLPNLSVYICISYTHTLICKDWLIISGSSPDLHSSVHAFKWKLWF